MTSKIQKPIFPFLTLFLTLGGVLAFTTLDPTFGLQSSAVSRFTQLLRYLSSALAIAWTIQLLMAVIDTFVKGSAKNGIKAFVLAILTVFGALNYMIKWKFDLFFGGRILTLLREPGILEQMSIGPAHFVFALLAIGVLTGIYFYSGTRIRLRQVELFTGRRLWTTLALTLPLLLSERVYSSYLLYAQSHQTLAQLSHVPVYRPISLPRFWESLKVQATEQVVIENYHHTSFERTGLSYRIENHPLPGAVQTQKNTNVLFVFMESLRADLLTPEVMPNLWQLAHTQGTLTNDQHYSIGNSTAESLFGGLSGQNALYWYQSKEEGIYPASLSLLRKAGYRTNLYYTSDLNYRQINRYVFNASELQINNFIHAKEQHFESRRAIKASALEADDLDMIEAFEKRPIANSRQMDILYFYSGHYNYYYPKEFEKFRPALSRDFGLQSLGRETDAELLHNRYKNSAYFVDHLMGRVLNKLKKEGVYERTLVVVVGDHGEELFELGKIGHSTALNHYQTRTPFVLKAPTPVTTRYRITSHADIMPTILSYLGMNIDLNTFFSGKNLLDYDPKKDWALILNCLRKEIPLEFAWVSPEHKLLFDNQAKDIIIREIETLDDHPARNFTAEQIGAYRTTILAAKRHFLPGVPDGQDAHQVKLATDSKESSQ